MVFNVKRKIKMNQLTEEKRNQNLEDATEKLVIEGWISLGDWLFFKHGKIFDLSAADLNQLEKIECDGLFVVAS